jgi:hypothetical protein
MIDIQNGWRTPSLTCRPCLPVHLQFSISGLDHNASSRLLSCSIWRPADVPIADEHNFRAVNWFMREVRPVWRMKAMPARYRDLETVSTFMASVLTAWRQCMPVSAPSKRTLDQFLMMYGKA